MAPSFVHAGLRLGFLILILAVLPLPFVPPSSAEFVVSTLTAILATLFIGGLVFLALKGREP